VDTSLISSVLGAQLQTSHLNLALVALRQAAAAEAQVAQLLQAQSQLQSIPDPSSLLGQNIDILA
jgi:hypothetical protein